MTFAVPSDLNTNDVAAEAWFDQVRDNFTAMSTWASYTPTWTQSATITKTIGHAYYLRFGDVVFGHVKMTATSVGTGSNAIAIGLPVAHDLSANSPIGDVWYQDAGTDVKVGLLVTVATAGGTTAKIQRDAKTDTLGTASDAVTVASSDIVGYTFLYKAQ